MIDTVMYLGRFEDEGIEFVASNDDRSFGQYCSTIVETLPAGTYEIYINNYFGGGIGAYELSVRFLGGCGDSIIDEPLGETCDDGNTDAGDGCSAECRTEAVCGDGAIQEGETCDDEAVDCIQCQTIASQMATVGAYVGGMQTGGFDLFEFNLDTPKTVGLETVGGVDVTTCPLGLDTVLTLSVDDGSGWTYVDNNDDHLNSAPGSGCSRLVVALEAGRYQVRINEYDNLAIESYALLFNVEGVCGDGTQDLGEGC